MRILSFAFIVFLFLSSSLVFAQAKKKPATGKAAESNSVSAPISAPAPAPANLETKEPSFAGFTGSFLKFGKTSGNTRPFTMSVDYGQWHFEAKGVADAGRETAELDAMLNDLLVVLAYYNAKSKAADGSSYQPGIFDLMIYLEDEPIKISNVSFTLIGNASAGSSVLEQAKEWNFKPGSVFKAAKYSNPITKAQATAMDKSDIEKEQAAERKKIADSIAKEEKRVADSIAKVEKRRKDSIAKEKQRISDSIAEFEALKEQARRKEAAKKKKAAEYEDDDDYEPPKKKKKRPPVDDDDEQPVKKKKKRPVVEDDDDDYEPPPKKKTKKRS